MNPSVELRLRTMMRAMTEVILPAIDPTNSLAQEQARLLLGHLHALALHAAHEGTIDALEETADRALARALLAAAAGGPHTRAAQLALDTALPGERRALLQAIEGLLLASGIDGSPEFQRASQQSVLAQARAAATLGRTWFKTMGFDPTPAALPDIQTLIDGAP